MRHLTPKENEVVDLLADAWIKFNALPVGYALAEMDQADKREFTTHLHALQNILASRAVYGLPEEHRQ